MKIKTILTVYFISVFLFICPPLIYSQDIKPIKLLAPRLKGGKSLMQALKGRKSSREFSSKELPLQVISNLLWAANGINRLDSGYKTAPSVVNIKEIDIYLAKADGLYLFDAKQNMLIPVVGEDIRVLTGKQQFVKDAPINLIYVVDLSKIGKTLREADYYTNTDTGFISEKVYLYCAAAAGVGFISENVYLYCASAGLATVVRGLINRSVLAKAMKLRPDQIIIFAQTVGYFKN